MSTQPSAGIGRRTRDLVREGARQGVGRAAEAAADRRAGDKLTRDKLIEAAGHVFAERGYQNATVREICRMAGANVASVNYTFGDKLGLYTEVLRQSVRAAQTAALTRALESESPEEMLRGLIQARLQSLHGEGRPDWHFRIMLHEFAQPTPALDRVVDEGFRPVYERASRAVGEILGLPPNHQITKLCMNSIVGQFLFYKFASPCLSRLQPELKGLTPEMLERIGEHIYQFSMAYLRQVRAQQGRGRQESRTQQFARSRQEKNGGSKITRAPEARRRS